MNSSLLTFLNTEWLKHKKNNQEPLQNRVWLQTYTNQLFDKDSKVMIDGEALIHLREHFILFLEQIIRGEDHTKEWVLYLNEQMSKSIGFRSLICDDDRVLLKFHVNEITTQTLISELCYQFYRLIFEMDRSRIRICENSDCRYIFYDDSKNKSKRHCHSGCSNIMKVRRFREKQKLHE